MRGLNLLMMKALIAACAVVLVLVASEGVDLLIGIGVSARF